MKYKYHVKKQKESYPMEIACAHCKTTVFIYQKRGPGGLLKIHLERIIESNINLSTVESAFLCPNCDFPLANKKVTSEKILFRVIRGHVNTKKLKSYRY